MNARIFKHMCEFVTAVCPGGLLQVYSAGTRPKYDDVLFKCG